MRIVYSEKSLAYAQEGHPESPQRVAETARILENDYEFVEADFCKDADIARVHTPELVAAVTSGNFFDRDTPALRGMRAHAARAAGGGIRAAEFALKDETALSLMRPPGHHAGRAFLGGFCYLNNIAIAVKKILAEVDRVAILDIDGHHGNGTQDIFLGADDVLFVSLHQSPAFPHAGLISDRNCINYPLRPGTTPAAYLAAFRKALGAVEDFSPDIVAVSAGFDTYKGDPLLEMDLDIGTFFAIGDGIRALGTPRFAVLEGGYSDDLPQCVHAFLRGFEQ